MSRSLVLFQWTEWFLYESDWFVNLSDSRLSVNNHLKWMLFIHPHVILNLVCMVFIFRIFWRMILTDPFSFIVLFVLFDKSQWELKLVGSQFSLKYLMFYRRKKCMQVCNEMRVKSKWWQNLDFWHFGLFLTQSYSWNLGCKLHETPPWHFLNVNRKITK